jgi:signal transduction histidine kinase
MYVWNPLFQYAVRHTLLNLVQNALDHGRAPVTVRTSLTSAEIQITVEDCGAGLSEAEWSEALRPFRRLHDPPGGSHTGLGLSMVERLVRGGGGHLHAARIEGGFAVMVRFPTLAQADLQK